MLRKMFGSNRGAFGSVMPISPISVITSYENSPFRMSIQVDRDGLNKISKQTKLKIVTTKHYDPIREIKIEDENISVVIWSY